MAECRSPKCEGDSDNEEKEEELDPRIKLELENLNAATDGINHLETEFGEAQILFQQMMDEATFQLKSLSQELGKSVEKSRPYYEALKIAKQSHATLHDAALKFEQAQSRHYNARKRVMEAEGKAFSSSDRKLDPALQEMLNQVTIEVMNASKISQVAWEKHRVASIEFDEKQKAVQVLYKTLLKHVLKSRPYFEKKFAWNKQLEIQKQRLEKIKEGIKDAKLVYSETLHNLEKISDDIHKSREEKRHSTLLGPRGEAVGADSDQDCKESMSHSETLQEINKMSLDDITLDNGDHLSDSESTDTDSEVSGDDSLFKSDTHFMRMDVANNNNKSSSHDMNNTNTTVIFTAERISSSSPLDLTNSNSLSSSLEEQTENTIKEITKRIDSSYEVITSHSIPITPLPVELLPEFDITDFGGNKAMLCQLRSIKRARSFTDLRTSGSFGEKEKLLDITKTDNVTLEQGFRPRSETAPRYTIQRRKWGSFSVGMNSEYDKH